MIDELYDSYDNLICDKIIYYLPRLDAIKIKNRLLDGSYQTQTIGSAAQLVDIVAIVDGANKNIIDQSEATCAPVKLITKGGDIYKGSIMDPPQWQQAGIDEDENRLYQGQFTIGVDTQ